MTIESVPLTVRTCGSSTRAIGVVGRGASTGGEECHTFPTLLTRLAKTRRTVPKPSVRRAVAVVADGMPGTAQPDSAVSSLANPEPGS